jgi:hypothetical protein
MTVSLVGRMTTGSARSSPPAWVTTATSGLNPSTCSASLWRYDSGMNRGKYALRAPAVLMRSSS